MSRFLCLFLFGNVKVGFNKCLIFVIFLLPFTQVLISQNFINGDLEGDKFYPLTLPYPWTNVKHDDEIYPVGSNNVDSPDVTDVTDSGSSEGVLGNPYSGNTFISGRSSHGFQEGIKQTVYGFTVDSIYTVSFYQSLVKQASCQDTVGAWKVYVDNQYIATSYPSSSSLPYNSVNLVWEYREISFTATADSHVIKFVPLRFPYAPGVPDGGGVRMGIDYIYIGEPVIYNSEDEFVIANVFTPNDDHVNDLFLTVKMTGLKEMHVTILNRWGKIVHKTTDPYIQWRGEDMQGKPLENGTYFYLIDYINNENVSLKKQGFVTLIR